MALNQATKYGLFFVGGIAVGALGMALVSRGKLNIKPLATDLLASGIDLRDKALLPWTASRKTSLTWLPKPR